MTEQYKTLALDLGNDLGWAYAENWQIKASGTTKLKQSYHVDTASRWNALRNFIYDFNGIDWIIFEEVKGNWKGASVGQIYGGYKALVQLFAKDIGAKSLSYLNWEIKFKFTGNRFADKTEVCRVAHEHGWKGGVVGTDKHNDEADACALMIVHGMKYGKKVTFN